MEKIVSVSTLWQKTTSFDARAADRRGVKWGRSSISVWVEELHAGHNTKTDTQERTYFQYKTDRNRNLKCDTSIQSDYGLRKDLSEYMYLNMDV